jgi:branched-chain amino acid transport system ATP-binding protein
LTWPRSFIDNGEDGIRNLKARGATIIVVEHVMKAILAVSDRVLLLVQGKILTEGDPREVLANPEVLPTGPRGGDFSPD